MTKDHGREGDVEGAQRDLRSSPKEQGAAPLVSVVIPCYNQGHFLGEAIESVLSQSYPNFEIVVVDDGSTDETSEVAERYPRVRLVRQENQGLSAARNSGLAHSEGEYMVFLDADDRLLPEALEVGLECLEAHPESAFVSGHYKRIAEDGSTGREPKQLIFGKDRYLELLLRNYIRMPALVMYHRAVFDSVGGFNSTMPISEDHEMYLRIARRFSVCSHEKVVAEYRRHGANMTGDAAYMLAFSVAALRFQWKHVKGSKQYEEAYTTGIRQKQGTYGDRLVGEVRGYIRGRHWKRALRGH